MSVPDPDQSSATAVGEIIEEDGDGRKGNPGCLSKFGLSRAKQVIARTVGKSRRMLSGRRSRKRRSTDRKDGGIMVGFGDECCCCRLSCVRRPKTLGSPVESIASDPNDPDFTLEMLRDLLQRNEFFSVECSSNLDSVYSNL